VIEDLSYSILNFKSINTDKWIKLDPITIFCGVNSSGKSSILQSHLVIAQTIIRDRTKRTYGKFTKNPKILAFEGKLCHLEGFRNIIFENNLENCLNFQWKFKRQKNFYFIKIKFRYYKPDVKTPLQGYPIIKSILIKKSKNLGKNASEELCLSELDFPNYSLKLKNFKIDKIVITQGTIQYIMSHLRDLSEILEETERGVKIRKDGFKLVTKILPGEKDERVPDLSNLIVNNVKLRLTDFLKIKIILGDSDLLEFLSYKKFINLLGLKKAQIKRFEEYIQDILESAYKNLERIIEEEINDFIFQNLNILSEYYETLRYLGPVREEPKRFYTFTDFATLEIGVKGENTPLILIMEQDRIIRNMIIEKENSNFTLSDIKEEKLLEALNKWLEVMDLQKIQPIKAMELITRLLIKYSKNQPRDSTVSLPDVGFGVSQLFPVLVETLRMNEDETLILEQPEIHLHPRLQGDLADFLLCQSKLGKKFLIETHSEHFLTRLCLRIAQSKDIDLSKIIKIYFIVPNSEDSGTKIIEVKLNEFGQIINWPKGFFDDNEAGLLLEASRNKKRKLSQKNN